MVRLVLQLDEAILLGLGRFRVAPVASLMKAFTRAGDAVTWVFAALVLLGAGGAASRPGLRLGIAAGIAALVSQGLKRCWPRPRPTAGIAGFTALVEDPDAFSFPSGHAATAFSVALAMAGTMPGAPAFGALALAIGVSRVYLGAHYPLDVVAGALIGLCCGLATRMVLA